MKFLLKGCGRCRGDLVRDEDQYGTFYRCMQCGRFTDVVIKELGVLKPEAVTAGESAVEKIAA